MKEATITLFCRYEEIISQALHTGLDTLSSHPRLSLLNLLYLCTEAITMQDEMSEDKLSRWLGFVQGCLAMRALVDCDEERDVSRPLFEKAYLDAGMPKQRSRQRNE